MIAQIKKLGFLKGQEDALKALKNGIPRKQILKFECDDKEITKFLMKEFKSSRRKSFLWACIYSSSYDKGISDIAFGVDV